jgi:L-fuconolactonase
MPVLDSQVHAYERDHPGRPWLGHLSGPPEVTGHDMVEAMDEVGVGGALLISPFSMYRFDPSYAVEVHQQHPGRFGIITPFDTRRDDVAEQVTQWSTVPGAVGARIILLSGGAPADTEGASQVCQAGAATGLPVNILCWGNSQGARALARQNPATSIVIDHLGITQPVSPPTPDDPWSDLDGVLRLADMENVSIKISGAGTLAQTPFPYPDIWEPLDRIITAFGIERCLWGTD